MVGSETLQATVRKRLLMSAIRHRVWLLTAVWLLWGAAMPVVAEPPPAGARCLMGAAAGARRYRPGSWSVVAVDAVNPTDEAAEVLGVVYFVDDPTLQYSRKIWVPARSIIRSTCPIRTPDSIGVEESHTSLVSVPIDPSTMGEMSGWSHAKLMDSAKPLIIDHERIAVGILGDFDDMHPAGDVSPTYTGSDAIPRAPDDPVYDVVLAAKVSQKLSRRVSVINAWEVAADSATLDALDVLVVCSDRLADDPDATALVRNWVLRGGLLWVMVDELSPDSISAILGDAFASTVVDRVSLTELRFDDERTDKQPGESIALELDESVAFVRVLPSGVTVLESVDGWPAAFWQTLGAGKVFYTTVGPAAWVRPATRDDALTALKGNETPFVAREPLLRLAQTCFAGRDWGAFDVTEAQPFLAKQIGYRILSREAVAAILAAFCVLLCLTGAWLWRIGRLDRLLWAGPLAVTGTSLVFLVAATTARNSVPPTVAVWQRVALEPGLATGQCCGLASIYNPEICDSELGATRGGRFLPDMTAMRGERRRMMWTDEGAWHWEGLELPPGIRTAPTEHIVHLEDTADCRARFGQTGLEGQFGPGPFRGLSDAVIVQRNQPTLAAEIRADGSFVSGVGDMLAPGQYVSDTWLSDVQQRRTDVYRLLLERGVNAAGSVRPVLFAWAEPLDTGFRFPQSTRLGSSLVSIPVQIERSVVGAEVTVPAPFIPFRGIVGPDGSRPSAYSTLTGEWGELKSSISEWLRFQLPESVLPIQLSRAEVSLDIRAPSRSVEILGLSDGTPVVVKKLFHPIGAFQATLDRPELLQLDEQGGLVIAIHVGREESDEPLDLMSQASWRIEAIRVDVVGTVQGE